MSTAGKIYSSPAKELVPVRSKSTSSALPQFYSACREEDRLLTAALSVSVPAGGRTTASPARL